MTSPITFTGPVYVTIQLDVPALAQLVTGPTLARIDELELHMTTPLTTIDEALAALAATVTDLQSAEAADRAAFDALAATVTAFLASLPPSGGMLTAEQSATAQAILDQLAAAEATQVQEAADEAALQGEVPATP